MCPIKEPKDKADSAVCVDIIFGQRSPENKYALTEDKNCVASSEP